MHQQRLTTEHMSCWLCAYILNAPCRLDITEEKAAFARHSGTRLASASQSSQHVHVDAADCWLEPLAGGNRKQARRETRPCRSRVELSFCSLTLTCSGCWLLHAPVLNCRRRHNEIRKCSLHCRWHAAVCRRS